MKDKIWPFGAFLLLLQITCIDYCYAQYFSTAYVPSAEYPAIEQQTYKMLHLLRDKEYEALDGVIDSLQNNYQWQASKLRKQLRWMGNKVKKRGIPNQFITQKSSVGAWLAREKMTMTRLQVDEGALIIASLQYTHKRIDSRKEAIHFVFDEQGNLLKMTLEAPAKQLAKFQRKNKSIRRLATIR